MKQRVLQAILHVSLCILPTVAFGQAMSDTTTIASSDTQTTTAKHIVEAKAAYAKQAEQVVVRIYPNPAIDKVTYTFPAGIQKHLLQVMDMGGRTILNLIVGNIGTQNTINTSAWKPGIYFVSINSSTFSKTFKLMKQ
jgi:hypothetical protein